MEELGFIITRNGEEIKFGEYKPYSLRDQENPRHYHYSSFINDCLKSEIWKSLNIELPTDFDITKDITLLASKGIIVGLNKTAGSFSPSVSTIILASPNNLSIEQVQTLMAKKESLLSFDRGLSYIYIINDKNEKEEKMQFLSEFYDKYVFPINDNLKSR